MAVLIECINVIVNDEAFKNNPSNRNIFLQNIPSAAFCSDGSIYRIGFMIPKYVEQYVNYLEQDLGLVFLDKQNRAKDIVVVDMLSGPTANCDWIGFKREKFFTGRKEYSKTEEDFSIAWRLDSFEGNLSNSLYNLESQAVIFPSENGIFFPHGWTPDKAIYASDFSPNPEEELEEVSRDETTVKYIKKSTGEIVYSGTPKIEQSSSQLIDIHRKTDSQKHRKWWKRLFNID